MKSIRSILSVALASLVLIASTGVTVNMHFCMGRMQTYALYEKAALCMMMDMDDNHNHCDKSNGCCEDKSVHVKGNENNVEVKTATTLSPSFSLIAVILPVLYSIREVDTHTNTNQYANYKPPLTERDITVLVHSFLI